MCGIIGYIGARDCGPLILAGLTRLEYRGYDSAGIAILNDDGIQVRRSEGKLAKLAQLLADQPVSGHLGVGHTRWATHGPPTETNAHPHRSGDIVVIQNGIIENYRDLRKVLVAKGYVIESETDTELVAHLLRDHVRLGIDLADALLQVSKILKGSFAMGVISGQCPDQLIGIRNGPPLVVGLGKDECFIASDVAAILDQTRDVIFLDDAQMVILTHDGYKIKNLDGETIIKEPQTVSWTPVQAEKGGYKHFMLKEIHDQPETVADSIRGRFFPEDGSVCFEALAMDDDDLRQIDQVVISACGTSYYAGHVGQYLLESFARLPTSIDLASEFRYRDPLVDGRTLVVSISQSGESADTLAAQRLAQQRGAKTLAICNVVGSTIAREAGNVIYIHAGPEISVASTKTFVGTMAVLYLFALRLARVRESMAVSQIQEALSSLTSVPQLIQQQLAKKEAIRSVAKRYFLQRDVLFLGRGIAYPLALEGALKLKEVSYIHAEGYAAGEMKHGPIALIDDGFPVVVLAANDSTLDKTISNVEEVRARQAKIIAIVEEGDNRLSDLADDVIEIPAASWGIKPFLFAIPLQLFAYYIAVLKGTDVDQPRNLAKSVTVE